RGGGAGGSHRERAAVVCIAVSGCRRGHDRAGGGARGGGCATRRLAAADRGELTDGGSLPILWIDMRAVVRPVRALLRTVALTQCRGGKVTNQADRRQPPGTARLRAARPLRGGH